LIPAPSARLGLTEKGKYSDYPLYFLIVSRVLGENRKVSVDLRSLWREERGQDLIEYTLLLAFICLAGAAAFIGMSNATTGLWSSANSRLAAANQ